ncbi:MAG: universal stress protein UspA [Minwuia thermotolerans]|nr:MAG: universal stress protein UspA [Minwuia thermotolerans]
MTRLLALIDGSVYSRSVCDHAAWAAGQTGASVELLQVLGRRNTSSAPTDLSGSINVDAKEHLLTELATLDQEQARLTQKRARLVLEEAKQRLEQAGVADVTARLRHGDLIENLQEAESDADLVIIGKRGEGADFAKLHLGSNLERVVRACHKPVLVTSRAFRPINNLLIAFDGGESAMKAVRHIAHGVLFPGTVCHLLTVGNRTDEAERNLENAAAILRKAGYEVETGIRPGQADSVIAAKVEIDRIDLLVMGAYGHSRIRSLIIGSTTSEMIRSCLVPVMLFR